MLSLLITGLLAQCPAVDAAEYVREHRRAHAALVSKKLPEARAGFERCLELSPENPTVAYELACVEARDAKVPTAFEQLARAVEWGYPDADVAAWDEDLASLRRDKRFELALDRMRLRATSSADFGRFVRIWEDAGCELTLDLAIDPSGRFVAIAQDSGVVRLLDSRTGHALRSSPPLQSPVWALSFDKTGERIAAVTWDGKLHLWRADGTEPPTSAGALDAPLEFERLGAAGGARVEFDPTGQRLLVAAEFRGASLWTASGEKLRAWTEAQTHRVLPVWSPDGQRIAYSGGGAVHFARATDGAEVELPFATVAGIRSFAFSADGRLFATGHDDNSLRVWDLPTRSQVSAHWFKDAFDSPLSVHAAAFSPDSLWIAGATLEDGQVAVLNARTGFAVSRGEGEVPFSGFRPRRKSEPDEPHELAWSSDSQRLWCGFLRGSMPVLEIRTELSAPYSQGFYGRAPRAGPSGVAFASHMRGVIALDATNGSCRWNRPNLAREGQILKTAAGYFTTDLDRLEGLTVDPGGGGEYGSAKRNYPLGDWAHLLFDPKRVRAARDGVAIVPARFGELE